MAQLHILHVYQAPQNADFCRKNDEKVIFPEHFAPPPENHFLGLGWSKLFWPAPNRVHKAHDIFMVLAPFLHSVRIQDTKDGNFGRKKGENRKF